MSLFVVACCSCVIRCCLLSVVVGCLLLCVGLFAAVCCGLLLCVCLLWLRGLVWCCLSLCLVVICRPCVFVGVCSRLLMSGVSRVCSLLAGI